MRVHLLGLAHTITHEDRFSHCAFTGKVRRMAPMLAAQGIDVVHYGVGPDAPTGAAAHVDVLPRDEWRALLGHDHEDATRFVGTDANIGHPVWAAFVARLGPLLRQHVQPQELVLLPFGHAHNGALDGVPGIPIESGIGYPHVEQRFRVYESYAWLHHHTGREQAGVNDYHVVIPNYYDPADWPPGPAVRDGRVAYLGRLDAIKGLDTVVALADARPDLSFTICGQGDPTPWLTRPNIAYVPPLHGRARAEYLGTASVVLCPSRYIEPFCGVAAEAQLCGTPVLGSSSGAFAETIAEGQTGWRCRTLAEWLDGIAWAQARTVRQRRLIGERARRLWSLAAVGPQYRAYFEQVLDLTTPAGWYTVRPSRIRGRRA